MRLAKEDRPRSLQAKTEALKEIIATLLEAVARHGDPGYYEPHITIGGNRGIPALNHKGELARKTIAAVDEICRDIGEPELTEDYRKFIDPGDIGEIVESHVQFDELSEKDVLAALHFPEEGFRFRDEYLTALKAVLDHPDNPVAVEIVRMVDCYRRNRDAYEKELGYIPVTFLKTTPTSSPIEAVAMSIANVALWEMEVLERTKG